MNLFRTVFLALLLVVLFACSGKEEPETDIPVEESEITEPEVIPEPEVVEKMEAAPLPESIEKPAEVESVKPVAEPPESVEKDEAEIVAPIADPSIPVDLEDDKPADTVAVVPGLAMKMRRSGEGSAVVSGDRVEVHYTGWIFDANSENGRGSKFDSSVDRGERYAFPLGEGRVIEGWDLGIEGMLVGEIRELKVAPELAYGDEGAGAVIPPGATLIFEIELFKISATDIN